MSGFTTLTSSFEGIGDVRIPAAPGSTRTDPRPHRVDVCSDVRRVRVIGSAWLNFNVIQL